MKSFELLSEITLTLINSDDFESQMNSVLKIVGQYTQVSRAYIVFNKEDGTESGHAYEWCNTAFQPRISESLKTSKQIIQDLNRLLFKSGRLYSDNIHELKPGTLALLKPDEILHIVVYPVIVEKTIHGFIGFDECNKIIDFQELEHNLIKTLSGIISAVYKQKIYRESLDIITSENNRLKISAQQKNVFNALIGASKEIENVFSQLEKVINRDINVLIRGESGTGKELIAKAIHNGSHRSNGPFITINCSAISTEIAESLLFGHRKGAFTGAHSDTTGYFEQADKGTLFLDEIGDMPLEIQSKILRVIEDKKIKPVGDSREKEVDCRIISATNINLEEAANLKKFRHDLFYRINEFPVTIPPLRERKGDIKILCKHFINEITQFYEIKDVSISDAAIKEFEQYEWPGNVRELKSTIQRLVLTCPDSTIGKDYAASILYNSPSSQPQKNPRKNTTSPESLAEIEKNTIIKVYLENNRNVDKTAEILKKGRTTVYRKLKNYDMI